MKERTTMKKEFIENLQIVWKIKYKNKEKGIKEDKYIYE